MKPKAREEVKKVEVRVEEKSVKTLQEEALSNKAIMDANDTEKAKKDVMLMNAKELEAHLAYLTKRIAEISQEYESRKKLVDGINGSIAGAQAELYNVRNKVSAENEKLTLELNKKLADVDRADKTLRALMAENEALNVSNRQKESALNEEKQNTAAQLYEMKKALDQNQSEWKKREADILSREKALKIETEALEVEKSSIAPELARISEVKNENILLLQELERERTNNRNTQLGIQSERQSFEEEKLVYAARNEQEAQRNLNEEKRLREYEQNLKDFDLDVRARSAKADKLLRQVQLEKEVNSR